MKIKYNIIHVFNKLKIYVEDFIEIVFISLTGLVGLIFIMTTPFEPPEKRNKSLYSRLKEVFCDIWHSVKDTANGNK